MQFRVLGAHQVESAEGRPTAFLVDDRIALDAGGLLGGLTMAQQQAIEAVLITHSHFDHVRDLPFLGLDALIAGRQVGVYCTADVKDVLSEHLMCSALWPDLFAGPAPGAPAALRHEPVAVGTAFRVGPYEVLPVDNRHHAVPVVGYQLTTPGGKRLLYTGDAGPGIRDVWPLVDPDVLVTEVTFPDDRREWATPAGHLTPGTLEAELAALRELKGRLPRVVVCHVHPRWRVAVARELDLVARRLGAAIDLADDGMQIDL